MSNRIENPCDEQEVQVQPLPACPPGLHRDENGRCVLAWQAAPDLDLSPLLQDDPYADNVFGVSPPPRNQRDDAQPQGIQNISYQSATREVSTIDEDTYIEPTRESLSILLPRRANNQTPWMRQKVDLTEGNPYHRVDPFRLAMLNYWYFDGSSEKMLFSPIVNPRGESWRDPDAQHYTSFGGPGDNTPDLRTVSMPLDISTTIPFKLKNGPHPEALNRGPEALPLNYYINTNQDFVDPVLGGRYPTLEVLPFEFTGGGSWQNAIDADFQEKITPTQFFDVYMRGSLSRTWTDDNMGRTSAWWGERPEVRTYYQNSNIVFEKSFDDLVFDSPAAFFQNEIDNININPIYSADVKVFANDLNHHVETERETQIPSVYHYHRGKEYLDALQGVDVREALLEQVYYRFSVKAVESHESGDSTYSREDELLSYSFKFPLVSVAENMTTEAAEDFAALTPNFVEITIAGSKPGLLTNLIYESNLDTLYLETLSPQWKALGLDPTDAQFKFENNFVTKKFAKVLDDQFIAPDSDEDGSPDSVVNRTINDEVIRNIEEKRLTNADNILEYISRDLTLWPRDFQQYPLKDWKDTTQTERIMFEERAAAPICLDKMIAEIEKERLDRTYADIIHGHKAYSEVLGYRVEKYIVRDDATPGQNFVSESKIQEFFFMHTDKDPFKFIDNQIIPGRKYKYKIQTINLVIGTVYKYDRTQSRYSWNGVNFGIPHPEEDYIISDKENLMNIAVRSKREINIIYAPYFEKTVSILDKPPISPQVTFLPYQGVDSEHAVLLQSNYGEIMQKPIAIFPEDDALIRDTYRTQGIRPGEEVLYKSDTLPTEFEIIRIDFAPEEYSDFASPTAVRIRKQATGKTAFCKVDIEPNKYYYYTFRVHDLAGMSNPTRVFRVRMVSYQNGTFMELDPYEMYKKPKKFELAFDRIIKIRPSIDQRMINFDRAIEEIEPLDDPNQSSLRALRRELGLASIVDTRQFQLTSPEKEKVDLGKMSEQDAVWDKNYKIRFKSKTSGKKFDVNMVFKKKKSSHGVEE